jgi:hypothetical protein
MWGGGHVPGREGLQVHDSDTAGTDDTHADLLGHEHAAPRPHVRGLGQHEGRPHQRQQHRHEQLHHDTVHNHDTTTHTRLGAGEGGGGRKKGTQRFEKWGRLGSRQAPRPTSAPHLTPTTS